MLLQHQGPSGDDSIIASCCMIATGILILILQRYINKRNQRNDIDYERTIAEIVGLKKIKGEKNDMNVAVIKYKTRSGEDITADLDFRTTMNLFKIGEEIPIHYHRVRPEKHYSQLSERLKKRMGWGLLSVALLFMGAGATVLGTIDYRNLEVVERYFTKHKPVPVYEEKIFRVFNAYCDSLIRQDVYLDFFDCDNYAIRKNDGRFKATETITPGYEMKLFYDYLNMDTYKDAFIGIIPKQCDGSPQNFTKQLKYIILSKDTNYYVDDTFFLNLETKSSGVIQIDSMKNRLFFGKCMFQKDFKISDGYTLSKKIKMNYPYSQMKLY